MRFNYKFKKKIINTMKIGLKDDKNEKIYEKERLTENKIIKVNLTKDSSKTNKQKILNLKVKVIQKKIYLS